MINFKKMDDKDFVFIKKSLDEKEEKEFSDFLKNRKLLKKPSGKRKHKTGATA
jgi:hypothetical protein